MGATISEHPCLKQNLTQKFTRTRVARQLHLAQWRSKFAECRALESLSLSMVYKKVMVETHAQLSEFIDEDKITTNFQTTAGHVWSIDHGRCRCGQCPYGAFENLDCCQVNNCAYDLSGDFMRATYGKSVQPRVVASSTLYWINQWEYWTAGRPENSTVMEWMIAYVPKSCEASPSSCKLQ